MKKNVLMTILSLGALAAVCSGCGKDAGNSKNTPDDFDAKTYASAYLDYEFKGDVAAYADLSGLDPKALQDSYDKKIASYADLSNYVDPSSPDSSVLAPDLPEKYTNLWKNIFQHANYTVVDAKEKNDSYEVTVETQKMNLYTPAADLTTAMWKDYQEQYSGEEQTDSLNLSLSFQADAWNQVLESLTFQEAETSTVTLSKDSDEEWIISDKDIKALTEKLLDTLPEDSLPSDPQTDSADAPLSEGMPDTEYPDDLQNAASYQPGETFHLKNGDKAFASFCLDQAELTEERNEQETASPEKVVVLTYTYQNEGYEFPILFDDMSFQVLEGDTVCQPYYLDSLIPANIAEAGKEAITGSLAYVVSDSAKEITVIVRNPEISDFAQITVPLTK